MAKIGDKIFHHLFLIKSEAQKVFVRYKNDMQSYARNQYEVIPYFVHEEK